MKPILFNTEMVKAILDGRKTTTRRIIKPKCKRNFIGTGIDGKPAECRLIEIDAQEIVRHAIPTYQVGDVLYVRETWQIQSAHRFEADAKIEFKAGGPLQKIQFANSSSQSTSRCDYDGFIGKWWNESGKWHPSLFMPKEAARLFLRVIDVKAERLQNITENGAKAEGANLFTTPNIPGKGRTYIQGFGELWNSTVKKTDRDKYGWNANPGVWVISFERCEKP